MSSSKYKSTRRALPYAGLTRRTMAKSQVTRKAKAQGRRKNRVPPASRAQAIMNKNKQKRRKRVSISRK